MIYKSFEISEVIDSSVFLNNSVFIPTIFPITDEVLSVDATEGSKIAILYMTNRGAAESFYTISTVPHK